MPCVSKPCSNRGESGEPVRVLHRNDFSGTLVEMEQV